MNHLYNRFTRHVIKNSKNLRPSNCVKNVLTNKFQFNNFSTSVGTASILPNNLLANTNKYLEEAKNSKSPLRIKRHLHLPCLRHIAIESDIRSRPATDSIFLQRRTIHRQQLFSGSIVLHSKTTSVRWFKSFHPLRVKIVKSKSYETDKNIKTEEKPETPGVIKKFKQMWKDYWYVVIPVHIVTSIGWYGGFYLLIKSGVDIPAILQWMGTSEAYVEKLSDSNLGIFALMLACYKIATPVRYTVTVGGSTWTVRYLNKKGYMTTNEIKEELTDRSDHLKKLDEKLQQTKTQVIDWKDGLKDEYERAWVNFAKKRNRK